jgi:ABC-type multidrug transport system ATPase subunit
VTRLFDGLAAVSNVNLQTAGGETVWLRGWNGSGKTTLLRLVATAIAHLRRRHSARLRPAGSRAAIRARSDLLSHDTRLYADLTAAENLRFACRLYGLDPRRAQPALEQVGLQDVAAVRAASFSRACASGWPWPGA